MKRQDQWGKTKKICVMIGVVLGISRIKFKLNVIIGKLTALAFSDENKPYQEFINQS